MTTWREQGRERDLIQNAKEERHLESWKNTKTRNMPKSQLKKRREEKAKEQAEMAAYIESHPRRNY